MSSLEGPNGGSDQVAHAEQPNVETQKNNFFTRLWRKDEVTVSSHEVAIDNVEESVPPVSFFALFRFSTWTERLLNVIGCVAAIAVGAAQPLIAILFGNLAQGFVTFTSALARAQLGDQSAIQDLPNITAEFRRLSNKNAAYLAYIGVGIFLGVFIYIQIWMCTAEASAKRIREKYLSAILRQDVAYFDKVGAGEVTTRIQNDTHLFQQAISEKVPLTLTYFSTFIAGFVIAFIRSWRLSLAVSSIFPFILVVGAFMAKFMTKYTTASLQHVSDGGTTAEEIISTIRTAQAFGTQKTLGHKFDEHITKARNADIGAGFHQGWGVGAMMFVAYASYALVFQYGTTLINQGRADVSVILNVGMAILIGSFSLALLAPQVQAIIKGKAAAAKLYKTIDRVPDIDSANPSGLKPSAVVGDIMFEDVSFKYPSRPDVEVLKNITVSFPAGKTVAIVGASGSGKSTIVALIERFYDPVNGSVKLDGVNIKDLNLKWLRSQIGFVMQEPMLFSTTVRDNVAQGLINTKWEHASQDDQFVLIKEACIKANAHTFVRQLPNGYDTLVGERGLLLSGGQKQRLAIARAIVSDPRILLFDEATSALDTQSEGLVQDALNKASAGRTTITIAHRLSTIKDADDILVMSDGVLLEHGTHDDLLRDENSTYSRLVRAQNLRGGRAGVEDHANVNIEKTRGEEEKMEKALARKDTESSIYDDLGPDSKDQSSGGEEPVTYSIWQLFIRMGKLNRESRSYYIVGGLVSILGGLTHPAFAVIYAKSLDGFSANDKHDRQIKGDRNALWMFIIALATALLIALQNYILIRAAANLTCKLRSLSFKAVLRQDIGFFDRSENSTGALTSNLSTRPTKIGGLAGVSLGAIVQSITTLIVGIIVGLVFAPKVALVGIACIPAIIWVGFAHMWVIVLKDKRNKQAHENSAQLACEAAGSIRTVAALTRENDCCARYSEYLRGPLRDEARAATRSGILLGFAQGATFWAVALVFWYGSRLVSNLEYTLFEFLVGFMGVTFGAMQAGNVFAFVPDVSKARGAAHDTLALLDLTPEIDAESTHGDTPVGAAGGTVKGLVRLEDVWFKYPTRPTVPVLRGMSFRAQPGTYVAIAGPSGSGKSTIVQMIERFYDPCSGEIYLDDRRIAEFNVQKYREQLALVSQEPTLYSGSVRFNILLGATKPTEQVTQEEIEAACRDANILDFVQSLPDGFETEVGGKGSQLSGGQKQRVAIARALLRNPKVLLLDEATSALDSGAEKVVQDALDRAAVGRTTIAIAHRLSTIQNANHIYFIKEGRVSEEGTHDELRARKGDYYEYCMLQALGESG